MKKILFILVLFASIAQAQEKNLRTIVGNLASEQFEGRFPGTKGDSLASAFIVSNFKAIGLKPFEAGNWFQPFQIPVTQKLEGTNTLIVGGESLKMGHDQDYMPMPFSGSGSVSASLAESMSFKGKVVLLEVNPEKSDRSRALFAQDRGAAAVIFVNPAKDSIDNFVSWSGRDFALKIPVIQIRRTVAEKLFGKDLQSNNPEIKLEVSIARVFAETHNIIGIVPGKDMKLKDQFIIVGAHYDHLGFGGNSSGSRRPDTTAIHYGADDNASGVAGVLALAKRAKAKPLARSVIFVTFSGEEEGTFGSKYFAAHMPVDTSLITAMINLDMIGSLRSSAVTVGGSGTSLQSDSLIHSAAKGSGLKVTCTPEGQGPSDHASFYAKHIPVFYFTTGGTLTYHTPEDKASTLNYAGMDSVVSLVNKLLVSVADYPSRLTFQEAGPEVAKPMKTNFKVTLGLMPDITGAEENGLRADIVVKGKPADLAGMHSGDVIIEMNGQSVGNIEDYMARLATLQPGGTCKVKVRRGSETLTLLVNLLERGK